MFHQEGLGNLYGTEPLARTLSTRVWIMMIVCEDRGLGSGVQDMVI